MYALRNCDTYTGDEVQHNTTVLIDEGRIQGLVSSEELPDEVEVIDLGGLSIAPGFIDIQVNGGGGVLFNDAPSVEGVAAIADAHARFGTTNLLPTFITGPLEQMRMAAEAVLIATTSGQAPGVLGIHFEGPFISQDKAGVHDPNQIRAPSDEDLGLILEAAPRVLLTLAPEVVDRGLIRRLVESSVIVSLGHTNATYEDARAAFDAGATCTTHLFNAMSGLTSRAPGTVGAALDDGESWMGVIVDGFHSAFPTVRIAVRAKRRGKAMLVTDAMPPVGQTNHSFQLGPYEIHVEGGMCVTDEGVLAGSALDMATAVRNCVQKVGIPMDEALRMASTYPAEFLGLGRELGRIRPGYRANIVIFNNQLVIDAVVIEGRYMRVA